MTGFQNFDFNLLQQIQNTVHSSFFDSIMPIITSVGNFGLIWIAISLLMVVKKDYRKTGILSLGAIIFSTLAGEIVLKNLVQRARPFTQLPDLQLLISAPSSWSFPSVHTTVAFAFFWTVFREKKKIAIPIFILAVAIAFSRMYLMVHYPSDVAVGVILGILSAEIVRWVYYKNNKGD